MNNQIKIPGRHFGINHNVTFLVRDANNMKEEEWKDIEGYEGLYQVSSYGNVKGLAHDTTYVHRGNVVVRHFGEHLMKLPNPGKDGYLSICLTKCGVQKFHSIHRLVAKAFIPQIPGKPQVNHKDGNKQNNHVDNLEWMDSREQQLHAWSIGLIPESRRQEIGEQARLRNTGVKFSDEHKNKISQSLKKYVRTESHKKHISQSLKYRNCLNKNNSSKLNTSIGGGQ